MASRWSLRRTLQWAVFSLAMMGAGSYVGAVTLDYGDALQKSFLFLEAQRSGKLPNNQRVDWRGDSGLSDGKSVGVSFASYVYVARPGNDREEACHMSKPLTVMGYHITSHDAQSFYVFLQVDLVGGYYDAGDNVKFGLPLAFTVTMLSWSVLEYRSQLESQGQLEYSLDAIKWGTDYLIKAHPEPNVLYGEVGDGDSDHLCWQRPEDMTTSRQAYAITPERPGSDLAGETAAAMAAASMAFRSNDPSYADELLVHSRQLFSFADAHRGKYDSSIPLAKKYYQSTSGYDDELLWAAMWLHEASGEEGYLKYVADNADQLGGTGWGMDQFSWDNKYAGVQLKVTKLVLDGKAGEYTSTFQRYQAKAEYYLCAAIHKNHGVQMPKTPGGMYWIYYWNNMQYVTTAAFLLTVGHDYYASAGQQLSHCTSPVDNAELLAAGKAQVDYILGNNNRGQSYLVGFGENYPQRVHHRAASMVAFKKNSRFIGCKDGYANWYNVRTPNPNLLVGAVVGGPDQNDDFIDQRDAYLMTEPAIYNTAPLVGVFARLQAGGNIQNTDLQQSAVGRSATHQSQVLHGGTRAPKTAFPPVRIVQRLQEEWSYGGQHYYKYAGSVENLSKHTVSSLTVVVHRLYGPLWGLTPQHTNGNFYTFPAATKAIAPRQKIDFTYIHHSEEAQIFVGKYTLV